LRSPSTPNPTVRGSCASKDPKKCSPYAIRDNKLCVDSLVDSRTYCGSVYKSGSAYVGCDPRYNGKCLSEYTKLVRGDPEKLE
jgi:hypothetical protein